MIRYPLELEQWWLAQARERVRRLDAESCLKALEPDVAALSDIFTVRRSAGLESYADDERRLLAYGLFYFPQTFVRTRLILSEWTGFQGRPGRSEGPFRILDLGCGLGAASFAALSHLASARPALKVELRGVDRSAASLQWMSDLFDAQRALWPGAALETRVGDLGHELPADEAWDLILVSFALNEALHGGGRSAQELAAGWLRRLAPGGTLAIVEPAGEEPSPRLEALRDALVASNRAFVLAPCLHARRCPLLAEGRAWCHEVRRWRVPETVAYLNRHLFRTVEDVKFSFLLLSNEPPRPAGDAFRMIAPMHKAKGRLVTSGCTAGGEAVPYEMLTRALDGDGIEQRLSLERGDLVRAESPRLLGDDRTLRATDFVKVFSAAD